MLVVQMATTHIAPMRQGGRMAIADQLPQFEAQERRHAHRHGTVYRRTGPCGRYKPRGRGTHMKSDANPVQKAHAAPRCTATSKRSGQPCKAPAVKGWNLCRMHGAGGGHGAGKENPAYKHGIRSRGCVEMRKAINELIREEKEIEALIK
ncbi:MAG: hypothetical protein WBV71_15440, partial [Roseobacter sp.]